MKLRDKQKKALRASIEHWEENVEALSSGLAMRKKVGDVGYSTDATECMCCMEFENCKNCPISVLSGNDGGCGMNTPIDDTPYEPELRIMEDDVEAAAEMCWYLWHVWYALGFGR